MAYGVLRIPPEEFKELEFRELMLTIEGWQERDERLQRESWERARNIAFWASAGNLKKGVNFNSLFKNPYVKAKKGREFTPEEAEARIKRLDELEYKPVMAGQALSM